MLLHKRKSHLLISDIEALQWLNNSIGILVAVVIIQTRDLTSNPAVPLVENEFNEESDYYIS